MIKYKDLSSSNIIEVRSVLSEDGSNAKFKLKYDGIHIGDGSYKVEFSYFPSEVNIDDEIDYYTKVNELTFAMGVVGEYLFIKGCVDDAAIWDKRFKQALFGCVRPRRSIVLPKRRWS